MNFHFVTDTENVGDGQWVMTVDGWVQVGEVLIEFQEKDIISLR